MVFAGSQTETIVTDLPDLLVGGLLPPIHLPSLPALTTLVIVIYLYIPLPQLTNVLSSIGSVPALTSVAIKHLDWRHIEYPSLTVWWVDLDRWLSRIARHAEVTGGLSLTLRQWPKGKSVWEGFLPEFRKSGGKIKVDHQ